MVNIEITNKCQLKCPACMRQLDPQKLRGTREHSFETLKVIFDTFPRLNFCGQISDPIYHREFHEILEYLKPETETIISTGGQGKSEEWWTKAFELTKNKNVRWRFGIDGLPKDSHKYRVGQDGEQVFEMMKLGKKIGARIEWQYIVFNYNENDIEEAEALANKHRITFILTLSNRFSGSGIDHLKPTKRENYIE
jgi:MoaA/NifB/PqqE/SkfB family radical SAM enzyme